MAAKAAKARVVAAVMGMGFLLAARRAMAVTIGITAEAGVLGGLMLVVELNLVE
jgi:glutaminase